MSEDSGTAEAQERIIPGGPPLRGPHPQAPIAPAGAEGAAPVTGNAQVDRAVASVADLGDLPVAEQYEKLVTAHETLHRALDADDSAADDPARGEDPAGPGATDHS